MNNVHLIPWTQLSAVTLVQGTTNSIQFPHQKFWECSVETIIFPSVLETLWMQALGVNSHYPKVIYLTFIPKILCT